MKDFKRIIVSLLLLIPLSACCGDDIAIKQVNKFVKEQKIDKTVPSWKTKLNIPPQLTFSKTKDYFWDLQTNQGNLTIKLFADTAPMHVSSTIYLTKIGFYDDLIFHRVISGFMAQGGDPRGNGRGNPGYSYDGEFKGNISHHKAGMLSMANAGPGTDGSQFFLTFKATPFLDGKHTVFGEIINDKSGTLTKLENLGSRNGRPKEPIKITKATIRIIKK